MGKLLLVDGDSVLSKVLQQAPYKDYMASGQLFVGGVQGFLSKLRNVVIQEKPDRTIIVWDGALSQRRLALLEDYRSGDIIRHENSVTKALWEKFNHQRGLLNTVTVQCLGVPSLILPLHEGRDALAEAVRLGFKEYKYDEVVVALSDGVSMSIYQQLANLRFVDTDRVDDKFESDPFTIYVNSVCGFDVLDIPCAIDPPNLFPKLYNSLPPIKSFGHLMMEVLTKLTEWDWSEEKIGKTLASIQRNFELMDLSPGREPFSELDLDQLRPVFEKQTKPMVDKIPVVFDKYRLNVFASMTAEEWARPFLHTTQEAAS